MKTNHWILCTAALLASLLIGCGGGGSGGGGSTPAAVVTASKVIGSAGGVVEIPDKVKLEFPAVAGAASTTVTITASSEGPASLRLIDGTSYEFGPSGTLTASVTVTVFYDPAKLPPGALESKLALYKVIGGAWTPVPNSSVDTVKKAVTAPLSSFSLHGLHVDNQFAGTYTGTYTSNSSGSTTISGGSSTSAEISGTVSGFSGIWTATVNLDGSISAVATEAFVGSGSVGFSGGTTIPFAPLTGSGVDGGSTVKFDGSFTLINGGPDVTAVGTWSSNDGATGKWGGNRAK